MTGRRTDVAVGSAAGSHQNEGISMKTMNKTKSTCRWTNDLLDELIEKENLDEMSLLDLLFIDEILNQKNEITVV